MPAPPTGWKLYIPGPTHVRRAIREAAAAPLISHRGAEIKALVADVLPALREAFGTARGHVTVLSCPSTAAMEAVTRAVVRSRRRVLHLTNGNFSTLWHELSVACGLEAVVADKPWGEGWDEASAAAAVARVGAAGLDAVMVTHCETSTGVLSDVAGVVAAVRAAAPEALVCSDVTSTGGGVPIDFDATDLDVAVGGVQKCWALPPALTLLCFSERARQRMEDNPGTGWTNHPLSATRFQDETSMLNVTPAIPLLFALRRQWQDIRASGGFAARFERHRALQRQVHEWAGQRGFGILARAGFRSPSVTSLASGGRFPMDELVAGYMDAGYFITHGYGKTAQTHWRIGHMGDHDERCLGELLDVTDAILSRLGVKLAPG